MIKDALYDIFERHLFDQTRPHQSHEELIFDVVAAYILHLMDIGNVPFQILDALEIDIREEVTEIYRKKTYGFLNLQAFRDSHFQKNPKRNV